MADSNKQKGFIPPVKTNRTQKTSPEADGSKSQAGSSSMLGLLTANWKDKDQPKRTDKAKKSIFDDSSWLNDLDTTDANTLGEDLREQALNDSDFDPSYPGPSQSRSSSQSSDDQDMFGFNRRSAKANQKKAKKRSHSGSNKENCEPVPISQGSNLSFEEEDKGDDVKLSADHQELVEVLKLVVKVMNDKEMSLEVVPFPSEIIRPLVEAKRMAQRKWTDFTCKGYRMKKWTLEIVKEYRSSGKLLTTLDKKLKSEGPKQYLKLLLKEVIATDDKFRDKPRTTTKCFDGGVSDAGDNFKGSVKVPKDRSLIGGIQNRALATELVATTKDKEEPGSDSEEVSVDDKRVQFELEVARRNRPRKSSTSSSKGSIDTLINLSAEQAKESKGRFEDLQLSKLARHKESLALKHESNLLMAKFLAPKLESVKMINIIGDGRRLAYSLKLRDVCSIIEDVKKYLRIGEDQHIDGLLRCYEAAPLTIVTDANILATADPAVRVKFTEMEGEGIFFQFCSGCCCDSLQLLQ